MKALLRRLAKGFGYEIKYKPRYLLDHPEAEYHAEADAIIARAILACDDPCFVHIGAYDGVANDPLRPFIGKGGLRGILVEPQPDVFAKLSETYADATGVTLENCGVGDKDGQLRLFRLAKDYLYLGGKVAKQLTSPYREKIEDFISWDSDTSEVIEEFHVPCYTVKSLLAKHGLAKLDLLLVDTEGYDYIILKAAGLAELKPALVLYEHKHLNAADQDACCDMLRKLGYRLHIGWEDTIAVDPARLT